MRLSQKCQYALRAVFELARRYGAGPVRIGDLARAQAIPPRFLEHILSELKRGGFVVSRRGKQGGYMLAQSPVDISVGDIIRFVDGPLEPVLCEQRGGAEPCALRNNCAFEGLWERAAAALSSVLDDTSYQDLLDENRDRQAASTLSYSI